MVRIDLQELAMFANGYYEAIKPVLRRLSQLSGKP